MRTTKGNGHDRWIGIKLLMTGITMTSIGSAVRQGVGKVEAALKS